MFRQLIKKIVFQSAQFVNEPAAVQTPAKTVNSVEILEPFSSLEFDKLLEQLSNGVMPKSSELLPFLNLEKKQHRADVNFRLAEACLVWGDFHQAKIFISRAWELSSFAEQYLPVLENVLMHFRDGPALREAYKRIGIKAANKGVVSTAIKYFDCWHQAEVVVYRADKYQYDYDVMYSMQRLADPFQYHFTNTAKWTAPTSNRKIRLGYLLHGAKYTNSILMKIVATLAKFHDQSRFELFFFCPEAENVVHDSPQGETWIREFEKYGTICCAPYIQDADLAQTLIECARKIDAADLDVLVTSAVLADFSH
ncbi:MAG: hypothetical protein IAF58_17345, partial [Leptolyngbya sp.]|nr:hypothetical protein [Candidatus Melainabacteria bacterium]